MRKDLKWLFLPCIVMALIALLISQLFPTKLTQVKATITPRQGNLWRTNEIRAVVDYSPEEISSQSNTWKEFVIAHVTIERNSWRVWKSPLWRRDKFEIIEKNGKAVQGAVIVTGPTELDEKGKQYLGEETTPMAYTHRYQLDYEISLAKSYLPKEDLIFKSQISEDNGLTLPISVTIPKNTPAQ